MREYEICYFKDDGTLAFKLSAPCANSNHAKVLAHAMKERDHKRLEVWDAETLVYERPQSRPFLDIH